MSQFRSLLRDRLADIYQVTDRESELLEGHYSLLQRWNQRLSLTSVTSLEEVVERHYCESVFLARSLPADTQSVIDVGSGAGFPGFPLAVLRRGCRVTLVESNGKKAVFLREASRGISNIDVSGTRAETLSLRGGWVVSRAVRWSDVVKLLPRLGDNIALLLGEADAVEAASSPQLEWAKPVQLPWGARRVLLIGSVPRGTV